MRQDPYFIIRVVLCEQCGDSDQLVIAFVIAKVVSQSLVSLEVLPVVDAHTGFALTYFFTLASQIQDFAEEA
ncbi:hypothetical protein PWG14_27435 [Chromobacterium amazonense]|uniref:hypothetical protein n=1 Tax=Chromobacterium amazonense TaxID=1382803 RepID=UPI00237E68AF|nr:hypothetical protein [Chromobacterium amazonense]MDE1716202.1 hypothetical protein [Chromobacterium amazonense]